MYSSGLTSTIALRISGKNDLRVFARGPMGWAVKKVKLLYGRGAGSALSNDSLLTGPQDGAWSLSFAAMSWNLDIDPLRIFFERYIFTALLGRMA